MSKFAILAGTELRLLTRNRTLGMTAVVLPIGLGCFWVFTIPSDTPQQWAMLAALQLAVVLAFSVYVTATNVLVTRRQATVLKRMRTSTISDRALLGAIVAPGVLTGLVQLVVLAVIDAVAGAPVPANPLALVLAAVLGLVLCVAAAMLTSIVTPSAERTQITTMPLIFVLMGGGIALALIGPTALGQALVALPGAAIGQLSGLAFTGGAWSAGVAGIPALLPSLLALLVWPAVFAWAAARWFRWERRV